MGAFKELHIELCEMMEDEVKRTMIEDLTNVREELEQEMRELIEAMLPKADKDERRAELIADLYQLLALAQKAERVQHELEESDDGQ